MKVSKVISNKLVNVAMEMGFNPIKIVSYRHIFRYLGEKKSFVRMGGHISKMYPILNNYNERSGNATGHYFHQDLLVAGFIHKKNPKKHIDVGSRVDGFVAHVASYRKIEVLDIRPCPSIIHNNIKFIQADITSNNPKNECICDSLSCLHALEHFGLGRYNDPIDPIGHIRGFDNLHRLLEVNGTLYVSFPIGDQGVHFNAHRVFHPLEILNWLKGRFELERFDYVNDEGNLILNQNLQSVPEMKFGCGIYTLRKISA